MDLLKDRNYGQMQSLIQQFCGYCKLPFIGDNSDFSYDLDLEDARPITLEYVSDEVRTKLENNDWTINIDFATVKSTVIRRFLKLIKAQLRNSQETCSAVGGNNKSVISSRILKYTYGCDMWRKWEYGDPIDRSTPEGFIVKFKCLARRGTKMNIDQEVTVTRVENQESMVIKLYYTREYDAEYCDDPGMKLLGKLIVNLPGSGLHRRILFGLTFGKMELIATSKNKLTGQSDITTFNFNLDTTATPNLALNKLVEQYNQSENDYKKSGSDKPKDDIINDTRILVAIDFGTTYSGFAYVHKENQETVVVNYSW
ncbi:hypothetical protein RhiirA4_449747 [Rhizophagus irregularis]|uniref:Hsp70 family protein n=1 Tax=Rhizophagus irregularis TaxID=588596 RepID=A0A2I1HPQ5_9GLOM|nr:hypothetical protein RhiirA4_449747 [Rhizophagus irregularis]